MKLQKKHILRPKLENKLRASITLNCTCLFMGKFNNSRIWTKKSDSFHLTVFTSTYT